MIDTRSRTRSGIRHRAGCSRRLPALLFALGTVLFPMLVTAAHVPEAPSGVIELENSVRVIADIGLWDPMLDVTWRFEDEDFEFRYRAITLGTYYRVHENVKVGAFYRLQGGVRHDDDWVEAPPPTEWEWKDTTDRYESVLIADVTPRVELDMIPGESWVAMLKNRYFANLYNGQQSLMVRPSLTYFWIVDREPVLNLTAAYGAYLSLNFGESLLYKRAPYLSALYHVDRTWKLEASVSRERVTWSTSEETRESGEGGYEVDYTPWVVSLRAIMMLDF